MDFPSDWAAPLLIESPDEGGTPRLGELLEDLALELAFAGAPQRVVLDLRRLGALAEDTELTLVAFLAEHAHRMVRLALVTADPGVVGALASLVLRSRRGVRIFARSEPALDWAGAA